jgi:hypothetical protein
MERWDETRWFVIPLFLCEVNDMAELTASAYLPDSNGKL